MISISLTRRLKLILACGCALICVLFVLRVRFVLSLVQGESMLPSLRPGDMMLIDKYAYYNVMPTRGDIIVAKYRDGFIVKRIVGLPGEEIEVKGGMLFISGSPLVENYGIRKGPLDVGRGKLFSDSFATLGDNRSGHYRQAIHPILQKDQIIGKVVFVWHLWF